MESVALLMGRRREALDATAHDVAAAGRKGVVLPVDVREHVASEPLSPPASWKS